ncbi:hypothetical protein QA645_40060 [Bradyrhizobium sp. CIAT3101]|uniref:hypothetical protein n=1 Tax=Bradyrhizobium sp. CIAT3101 TaxID=439387 RepID=UPI0024B1AE8D|nr:hypothetical protein [Bradyrhizobium sp. CIAT3101]WFU80577.1 hypothetical protein QA645_40060 [Bradyrhizobium sp. CIAT3101]
MDRVYQKFAQRLTECTPRDAAQQSIADVTAALKFSCFGYLESRRTAALPATCLDISILVDRLLFAARVRIR